MSGGRRSRPPPRPTSGGCSSVRAWPRPFLSRRTASSRPSRCGMETTSGALIAVLPGEMSLQQRHVAPVRAPHHVEHVAHERHRADHAVQRHVGQHARDQMARRAERARLAHDVERHHGRDRVADAGDETDQRVDAEPDIGARHDEGGVEQRRQRVEPRDALSPRLRRREIMEFWNAPCSWALKWERPAKMQAFCQSHFDMSFDIRLKPDPETPRRA